MKNFFTYTKHCALYRGDCFDMFKRVPDESVDIVVTSPPYCMHKAYESPRNDIRTFRNVHSKIFPEIYRVLKPGGGVCWQTGYHVSSACVLPLDYEIYNIFTESSRREEYPFILRNRIIWTFGHGLNAENRFSGRHETILWFSKGAVSQFNLDSVRIPQKYPGKKGYKGKNKGQFTGNPLGKNPSDVWDIPNVKANHIEKTSHPCQFPVAIPLRLIKALTNSDEIVMDPFMGVGSTGVAAVIAGRRFIGAEIKEDYFDISIQRIMDAEDGVIRVRPDVPVKDVDMRASVARLPKSFRRARRA